MAGERRPRRAQKRTRGRRPARRRARTAEAPQGASRAPSEHRPPEGFAELQELEPSTEAAGPHEVRQTVSSADDGELLASPEHERWCASYTHESLPSLFLDPSLRIVEVNDSFRRMFDLPDARPGVYLTRFFAPFFDETRSADLFRAVRSEETGWRWSGEVERTGPDRLLRVARLAVVPLRGGGASGAPRAYGALYTDITAQHRQALQNGFASLLEATRKKDNDTGNHDERINHYSRSLAGELRGEAAWPEVDQQFLDSIGRVAALHDVGKIGTPDDILNKAGPLERWEWDVMERHTIDGAYILNTYPDPMARDIALRHHEWWDGSGYPYGLAGTEIPLCARIVIVADVYDALRMRRPYKDPFPHERAVETIREGRGSQFDPQLVDRFLAIANGWRRIFSELAESAEAAFAAKPAAAAGRAGGRPPAPAEAARPTPPRRGGSLPG